MEEPRPFLFPRSCYYCHAPSFHNSVFTFIAATVTHSPLDIIHVQVSPSLQPDRSNMPDTQHNVDLSDIEQFFDLEHYYEESCAEPDITFDSRLQAPNESRRPSQISGFEPSQVEVTSSKAAAVSHNDETIMRDVSFESLEGPSQPLNDTRNEVLHDQEHRSGTYGPSPEIVHIDDRIEEIDLILERRRLQKRRQAILQNLLEPQQAQTSERPQPQAVSIANDSGTQSHCLDVTSDEVSKKAFRS